MADLTMISPVKRNRLKLLDRVKRKKDMRDALPVLTRNEIRKFRLPYHVAVIAELDEQGFASSADYLNQLIEHQEELRQQQGPDSPFSAKPRLCESRKDVDLLYSSLTSAETAHYKEEITKECDELIKLGVHYYLGSEDWWWLGEQLLAQAVVVCATCQKDGGQREAFSRYVYGKFLLEHLAETEKAKEELTKSRQLSTGKQWIFKLDSEKDILFMECCRLLYKALMIDAKEIMPDDPLKAARICAIAMKRAKEACDHENEAYAVMLQGICEMDGGDSSGAIISLTRALALYTKCQKDDGICEVRIHLGLAYLKLGRYSDTYYHLETLLEYALAHELIYYVAQAYRFLGDYHINHGDPKMATPLLKKALGIFEELGDHQNCEQTRNLAAISAGQELIEKYVRIVLKCGKKGAASWDSIMKLVRWKDLREEFWQEDEVMSHESSLYDILAPTSELSNSLLKLFDDVEGDTEEEGELKMDYFNRDVEYGEDG